MRKQRPLMFLCFLVLHISLSAQKVQVSPDGTVVKVYLEEKLPLDLFALYAGEHIPDLRDNMPAMLGKFHYEKNHLYFTPIFPFQTNRKYHLFQGEKYLLSFQKPKKNLSSQTLLTHIFPSTQTVPENLLKIYLHFSAPMREGFAYPHISITNSKGDTLIKPILELTPELWNRESKRLTLWFDPGRIKRDLIPNKDMGTPLEAGETYTLHISENWKDASGNALASGRTHTFQVEKADRIKPRPLDWFIESPKPASQKPLYIDFGESMDHALALSTLTVWKGEQKIDGEAFLLDKETIWGFRPIHNWEHGDYTLYIESRLEDLAGNNLNRLFDRDILKEKELLDEKEIFKLEFTICEHKEGECSPRTQKP